MAGELARCFDLVASDLDGRRHFDRPAPKQTQRATGSSNNPYQYTGRENDGTGLYYYRARYYSPMLKRFISEDPMGLAAGLNSYAYAGGDPIDLRDPSGLFSAADLPTIPQPAYDFTMGVVDDLSLQIGPLLRSEWGLSDGELNKCSFAYKAGGYASLIVGLGRLTYAGVAKTLPYLVRKGSTELEYALAVSGGRNLLKRVARGPLFWINYKIYPSEYILLKYGDDAATIIQKSTETSNLWNAMAIDAVAGYEPCECN